MNFFFIFTVFLIILFTTTFATDKYVPDASLSVPKIIKNHGYPSESHIVDTKDGYLLEIHRIPHGKNKQKFRNFPVLLQHGVVASSADWIINGPSKALAYQLADQGFDIWLGNSRGNTYSRSHKIFSPDSEHFWNFSFHEMGIYDMPATIDYILEQTKHKQLHYVGHSMGTCLFFVMCSMLPEYNNKIRVQISLAPVAYVHHMTSMLNGLVPFANQIQKATKWVSKGAVLPQNSASKILNKYLCGEDISNSELCKKYILYKIFGENTVQFDEKLLPIILAHSPAGTSVKTLMHFAQEIETKQFQLFDYGPEENKNIYNCSYPPNYNLSNIITPIAFYYAKKDILADSQDVIELYTHLRNRLGLTLIDHDEFNHVDFLYSRNVSHMVYNGVIKTISKADFLDWVPVYDNTASFYALKTDSQCNNSESHGRISKRKKKGFWKKITSLMKMEVQPMISTEEEYNENTNKSRINL